MNREASSPPPLLQAGHPGPAPQFSPWLERDPSKLPNTGFIDLSPQPVATLETVPRASAVPVEDASTDDPRSPRGRTDRGDRPGGRTDRGQRPGGSDNGRPRDNRPAPRLSLPAGLQAPGQTPVRAPARRRPAEAGMNAHPRPLQAQEAASRPARKRFAGLRDAVTHPWMYAGVKLDEIMNPGPAASGSERRPRRRLTLGKVAGALALFAAGAYLQRNGGGLDSFDHMSFADSMSDVSHRVTQDIQEAVDIAGVSDEIRQSVDTAGPAVEAFADNALVETKHLAATNMLAQAGLAGVGVVGTKVALTGAHREMQQDVARYRQLAANFSRHPSR